MTPTGTAEQDDQIELGFEDEDRGNEAPPAKPWDPSKVRVGTKTFSLRQIVDEIQEGAIDLAPDFQRDYVWKDRQKTLLIESILLGIPLPAFYFSAGLDGSHQVVDGVQRLSTVRDFAAGAFELSDDLEYLRDLAGTRFGQLDALLKRRFQRTQIVVHVIEASSPADLKYDIFKRINTGGSPLMPQEIRHCMSRARSRDLLRRLATLPAFLSGVQLRSTQRMEDRELVLRFVAFLRLYGVDSSLADYSKYETLDSFLLAATEELDDPSQVSDIELLELETHLQQAMQQADRIFGKHAFRKWPTGDDKLRPLNRPLFECWTVILALAGPITSEQSVAIRDAARVAMSIDDRYKRSITGGTGKPEQVKARFQATRDIVDNVLRKTSGGPP